MSRRERFEAKVEKTDGCWLWTGATSSGYGRMRWEGGYKRAHRIAFFFEHGRWPVLYLCHSCDTPLCVNPAHLFEGTSAVNMLDAVAKGRKVGRPRAKTCKRGHKMTRANTHINHRLTRDGRPSLLRRCRTCMREREAARYAA